MESSQIYYTNYAHLLQNNRRNYVVWLVKQTCELEEESYNLSKITHQIRIENNNTTTGTHLLPQCHVNRSGTEAQCIQSTIHYYIGSRTTDQAHIKCPSRLMVCNVCGSCYTHQKRKHLARIQDIYFLQLSVTVVHTYLFFVFSVSQSIR